ncbi:MAG: winged helix-turn-helix domain-containing protein [Candidatus ainarchaeum sp.]|jgi:predicted transcriptional regulator|nr:winged helix-turn-helix domain-containing protein [Candidatus ainarchaeum sp.]MDD3085963.1 winged helix-turn-helix domain-containing protein [Candidatus ainarchaeum sp.]MDD4128253.1 winged helix-turn-helix domain-containing protein [Candidatus ainarchaeum sp.]MDD4467868.1 winged helix-turn-helix domain-containing protein [Candidatus ainarchaeum sp.]HPM85713.1 winged helix-turn-helix domain-containing protein [archaeon]
MPILKQLLDWLILGSKGGISRAKILLELKRKPSNIHALSIKLEMDYKTIQHHINILLENQLITSIGKPYGKIFFISPQLESEFDLFKKMIEGKI